MMIESQINSQNTEINPNGLTCVAETIPDLLNYAVNQYSKNAAVKWNEKGSIVQKTYVQLQEDALKISRYLKAMGLVSEKVAMIGKLSYEWMISYFGIIGSGNIAVPIDKELGVTEIIKLLNHGDVTAIFFDEGTMDILNQIMAQNSKIKISICFQSNNRYKNLSEACWEADIISKVSDIDTRETNKTTNETEEAEIKKTASAPETMKINSTTNTDEETYHATVKNAAVSPEQTAMIVFTSGTTGESKGVMLSHKNICQNVLGCDYLLGENIFHPGECTIPVVPQFHMLGITVSILAPLLIWGLTICIGEGPRNFSRSLKLYRPVLLILVPMVAEGIYKQIWGEAEKKGKKRQMKFAVKLSQLLMKLGVDLRKYLLKEVLDSLGGKLKVIVTGGSYLDAEFIEKFQAFGIPLLNGYGITECSPVVSCNYLKNNKTNSVGRLIPEPFCQVKIQEEEILVRGTIVMQGYYKDAVGTSEAFDGEWFKTGDLGYLDKDNYLYLTGRKKNLIIRKDGNNISPEELERKIEQHPLVNSVFVYAKQKNHVDLLTAAIHPDYPYIIENNIDNPKETLEAVINEINQSLPMYKRIQMVEIQEEAFDRTALGKVKRYKYI